ncbi:aldo/keto reductase [Mangrovihabitans endophyticus]|uniref:Aldo/keto reductase n=1 Tax=Mangrovihabitans endophyticus TaxID=1751298 RepID=A0A8J3C3F2_9ACTN|nr:aldo/keto reductase [Mangrovihabitans endophyticus]GGL13145.1 aldo/keto reductase [Mangrovihabitans endophyticus]
MRYRYLGGTGHIGGTGMQVSTYCLGTMMFGSVGNPDHAECRRMIDRAMDAGVNFIDTADMYSAGESEEILGRALQGRRDDIVLATKGHFPVSAASPAGPGNSGPGHRSPGNSGPGVGSPGNRGPGHRINLSGNSRRWITRAVDDSLRRLRTDWIDLYQIHRPDPHTDIEETLSTLTDLVAQGKIRAIGTSSFPAHEIVDAQHVAQQRSLRRFRSEQPPYSLLARGVEAAVLPTCARYGMGVLTWSPLAWGFLSGRYRRGAAVDFTTGRAKLAPERFDPRLPRNAAKYDAVEGFATLAEEIGCTLPELALAFPIAHPAVTSVIVGPRTLEQLDSALAGADLTLDDAILDRIDDIVAPGTDTFRADSAYTPAALTETALRRRPTHERAAAQAAETV